MLQKAMGAAESPEPVLSTEVKHQLGSKQQISAIAPSAAAANIGPREAAEVALAADAQQSAWPPQHAEGQPTQPPAPEHSTTEREVSLPRSAVLRESNAWTAKSWSRSREENVRTADAEDDNAATASGSSPSLPASQPARVSQPTV